MTSKTARNCVKQCVVHGLLLRIGLATVVESNITCALLKLEYWRRKQLSRVSHELMIAFTVMR